MSKSVFSRTERAGRGFGQYKKDDKKQKEEREKKRGFLYPFFISKQAKDEEFLIRFLTNEPILAYTHNIQTGPKKYEDYPCTGDGCEHCAAGDRPAYKGSWLVADFTPWERDVYDQKTNRKTGEKETIPFRIRILSRGKGDIGTYSLKDKKFGLTNFEWDMTRVGEDSSTSYNIERGEEVDLEEDIDVFVEMMPKMYKEYLEEHGISQDTLMDIVEANVLQDLSIVGVESDEDEEEGEEEKPRKKTSSFAKKAAKKKATHDIDLSDDDLEDTDEDEDEEEDNPIRRVIKKKAAVKKKPTIKKRR